jgi:hypothetical protein
MTAAHHSSPRHSGNCAAIIRNLAFYYHWIPDIFPEIQEKFRYDGGSLPRHPGKRVSAYPGSMFVNSLDPRYFWFNYFLEKILG